MPAPLHEIIASGRIADLILVFLGLEALILLAYRRMRGRGVPFAELITNAMAGICLLLALRAALAGAAPMWVGLSLGGALVAHLADLCCRWRPH